MNRCGTSNEIRMDSEPEASIISYALDKAIKDNPALVRRTMIDLMIQVAELEREVMKLKREKWERVSA